MGTYTGTPADESITPAKVSDSVDSKPPRSRPSAAADTINGGGGDDTISGGGGKDTIYDRPLYSDDFFDGSALSTNAGNVVHGNGGDDDITIEIGDTGGANPAGNTAYGDDGDDSVMFRLSARGYDGRWTGSAPTGTVSLHGGDGGDDLSVRSNFVGKAPGMTVYQYGGAGNDKLMATADLYDPDGSVVGSDNHDFLYGGTGDDEYAVIETKDRVIEAAGEGYDKIVAHETDYTLPANVEALQMTTGYVPEEFYRGIGNSLDNEIKVSSFAFYAVDYALNGAGGNDTIYGSADGNDTIIGGAGDDALYGKSADRSEPNYVPDADTIRGGAGNDTIYGGGGAADTWDGDDNLYGNGGNDIMFGQFGDDRMYGGTGDDVLAGDDGNDRLYGHAGADTLVGGSGSDALRGGAGNDVFDYNAVADSSPGADKRDVIFDFAAVGGPVGDRIDLSGIDADATRAGDQAFTFVGANPIGGVGQVSVAKWGSNTMIRANTGGTTDPDLEILVKDGDALHTAWITEDFFL